MEGGTVGWREGGRRKIIKKEGNSEKKWEKGSFREKGFFQRDGVKGR